MHIDPAFQPWVQSMNLQVVEQTDDVVYFIDRQFALRGYNAAWETFARGNHGDQLLRQYPLKRSIMDAVPDVVKMFYRQAYQNALHTRERFDHDYECSSAEEFRLYHQTAYPLPGGKGLMITNHLVQSKHIALPGEKASECYLTGDGTVIQCCHCRKIRNNDGVEQWDWVPEWVEHPYQKTSHTFCPHCLEFYYPQTEQ